MLRQPRPINSNLKERVIPCHKSSFINSLLLNLGLEPLQCKGKEFFSDINFPGLFYTWISSGMGDSNSPNHPISPYRQSNWDNGADQHGRNSHSLNFFTYRCPATSPCSSGGSEYHSLDPILAEKLSDLLAITGGGGHGRNVTHGYIIIIVKLAEGPFFFQQASRI
jgi:hypothetical protein